MDPQQKPLLQNFLKLLAAILETLRVCVNPGTLRDLAVVGPVVGKDLLGRVAESRLNVIEQHR
jgi:hypothetical protein